MKILVPTDFSENAFLAARYAAEIAKKYHYSLHIIHFYTAVSSGFDENELDEGREESDLLKADLTIKEWVGRLQAQYPDISISYNNDRGLLEEALPKLAKREDYVAIAMGTTGASANKNIFWGSNTALIVAKSPIPVIVIPNIEQITTEIKKVGLLTNFKQEELTTLQEFVHIFKQEIDVALIHVYKESESVTSVNNRLDSWGFNVDEFSAVRQTNKLIAPTLKEDKDQDTIPEVISKLIDVQDIDIILVSKTRKTFFERLFTSSVSKAMTLKLRKPAFFGKSL
ncbi:universal stress protein [Sphingobacterium chuzhouense]|uniref:Universal stress protein n=1 Tax=Sphingobacterium chuzhouense TaxID=1742264 RepID=A0ABR7XSV2_9SPHI|nr:universal stress protein [Sphingobacterium chuzhouense]MBD1422223.1 universal stress protein [Sphingobacterium chuzhouense]